MNSFLQTTRKTVGKRIAGYHVRRTLYRLFDPTKAANSHALTCLKTKHVSIKVCTIDTSPDASLATHGGHLILNKLWTISVSKSDRFTDNAAQLITFGGTPCGHRKIKSGYSY